MWKSFFCKTGHSSDSISWVGWVASLSRELTVRPDCQFLSCSAPVVVTLQLSACFTCVAFWWVANREIQLRETSWMLTHLNSSHSSHTQPLHYSHLNIGYLIPKIQANLVRNKTNTWLNKFNLTHWNFINLKNLHKKEVHS